MAKPAPQSLQVGTVSQVYRHTSKANNGQVPRGSFAAAVASVAASRPANKPNPQPQRSAIPAVAPKAAAPKPVPARPAPHVQPRPANQHPRGAVYTTAPKSSPKPLPIRTVAQVYEQTAKVNKGLIPKDSFAADLARVAARHTPKPKGK